MELQELEQEEGWKEGWKRGRIKERNDRKCGEYEGLKEKSLRREKNEIWRRI